MSVKDLNCEIGERIMGWEVNCEERIYRDYSSEAGVYPRLPDFVVDGFANQMLRSKMQSLGYALTITENPLDFENNVGRTFTATYMRANKIFKTTQADGNMAVCVAALDAVAGFGINK